MGAGSLVPARARDPQVLAGARITLFLERSKNTRVWISDTFCGWRDSDVSENQTSLSSYCDCDCEEFSFCGKIAGTGDWGRAMGACNGGGRALIQVAWIAARGRGCTEPWFLHGERRALEVINDASPTLSAGSRAS